MTPYEIVREACVKANPDIELRVLIYGDGHICRHHPDDPCHTAECYKIPDPEIRLADVLLATEEWWATMYTVGGGLIDGKKREPRPSEGVRLYQIVRKWNLSHDSLEWHRDNHPETVEWLAELLTNKEI